MLKINFRIGVIAVILASIFAPISIANAGQNSIDILSVSEGLDNSVEINFISDFPENKVSSYEIIATADYSKLSKSTSISQATFSQEITSTKKVITKKLVVPALTKMQPPKVTSSELKQIQKLGKKLALKIAASNKGSVNKGAVASFAEGVCILYGDCRNQGIQSKVSNNQIYTYIFKPIISGISYVFEVASKNVFGTKITSAPFEYPPFSSLIDLISNLPADWGNPKPTPTTTPTPTAATAAPIVISVAAIAGVTAPVTGATPVTTTTAGTGYTGTVSWSTSPVTFAVATTYTATITLTATSAYTLTGVTANFFTVAGATSVTHSANSGVITAVFPSTEAAATKVAITRASVGTQRRTAFTTQPQIAIQNASSNTVTSSSAVITATVSAGGTLVGTTTATASSGVATFTNLGVDGTIGTTYTITYTAPGLTVVTATVTLTSTTCDGTTFTCQVGDTGPGGGMVFYVTSGTFTQQGATGSMCSSACKYLEAAPSSWFSSGDPTRSYSTGANQLISAGLTGFNIGYGYQNSLLIVAQSGNVAETSAAVQARAYTGGTKADWFLPSVDELNQLYLVKATVGGFVANRYWSSNQGDWYGRYQDFGSGIKSAADKFIFYYVRPIRAFGP